MSLRGVLQQLARQRLLLQASATPAAARASRASSSSSTSASGKGSGISEGPAREDGRGPGARWWMGLVGVAGGVAAWSLWQRRDMHPVMAAQAMPPSSRSNISNDKDDTIKKYRPKTLRRQKFNFIAEVVSEVAESLVLIKQNVTPYEEETGSGFIVSSDGLIMTNAHVVRHKRRKVNVQLYDGRVFTGKVESVDEKSDLATIRIPCEGLPVMPLGVSGDTKAGEFVIALGSPLRLSNTITTGIVSSVSRQRSELGIKKLDVPNYIQTDAAITFGNSGGPLVNLDGEAIGVNSITMLPGLSFAIPIDHAKEFLRKSAEQLAKNKTQPALERRYCGITFLMMTPEIRERLGISPEVTHGMFIHQIIYNSPAHVAGLLRGDIITHINNVPIQTGKDYDAILEADPEKEIKLAMTVLRHTGPSSLAKMQVTVVPE